MFVPSSAQNFKPSSSTSNETPTRPARFSAALAALLGCSEAGEGYRIESFVNVIPFLDAVPTASCTHYRATYPISKQYEELENGELKKFPATPLGKGIATLKHFRPLEELASFLDGFDENDAIGFGIPKALVGAPPGQNIPIVSSKNHNGSAAVTTRTRKTFTDPEGAAISWGDIDRAKGAKEVPDHPEFDRLLCTILPWWSGIRRFYRPSVSAFIRNGDRELSGRTGMRVYYKTDKGVNAEAILAIIADALWKSGNGWIDFTKAGSRQVRCAFDLSKFYPESLDYAGKPNFRTPGLSKTYVAPFFYGPENGGIARSEEIIAASAIGRMTIADWRNSSREVQAALEEALPESKRLKPIFIKEKVAADVKQAAKAAKAKGEPFDEKAAKKTARARWNSACKDVLEPDFVLTLAGEENVTVGKVLENLDFYDGIYCHDPIEPEYNDSHSTVARIQAYDKPHVWSWAHGGRYYALAPSALAATGKRGANGGGMPSGKPTPEAAQKTARIEAAGFAVARKAAPEAELKSWPSKALRLCPPYTENCFGLRLVTVDKNDKETVSPLTNFCARIVREIVHDDGAEISRRFEIEGYLDGRYHLFTVSAAEFARMDWVISQMGSKAIIAAGHGKRDHLRAAIQTLSPQHPPEQRVYAHTGWRKIDGQEVYLHAGGAIGVEGAVPGIETDFSAHGRLALALLPDPPSGEALKRAIRGSLAFLDLGPYRITAPAYAAIWRAPLKDSDFSISESGETGVFKTEIAALAQQHWGAGFIASHLPGSWASTGNSLETMAFAAKDMIFVVDDFAPSGARTDIDRQHREAARLYRAQGNQSGRGRLRADAAQRPAKYPRGIIMSTGEDLPRGHSVQARQFIIEVQSGDIDIARLTLAQKAAADGAYAEAMAGWLRYLAATPAAWGAFKDNRDRLGAAAKEGEHARTPRIASNLLAALRAFLDFAVHAGAIGAEEAEMKYGKCEAAIREGAGDQQKHMRAQDPALRFFDLIGAALATGKAHLAGHGDGQSEPLNHAAWGWQQATWTVDGHRCTDIKPKGELIGWTDNQIVWLEPSAAYGLAQKLAAAEGMPLSIGKETLWRRLADANKLAASSGGRNLHKKNIGGANRNLLAVTASALRPPEEAAKAD